MDEHLVPNMVTSLLTPLAFGTAIMVSASKTALLSEVGSSQPSADKARLRDSGERSVSKLLTF